VNHSNVDPIASHVFVLPTVRELPPDPPDARRERASWGSPLPQPAADGEGLGTLSHLSDRRRILPRRRRPISANDVEQMVRATTSGDPAAWTAIRERYGSRVRSVARRHRLATADVEDVAQTTWLRLFEHIGSLRDPRALGAWLETTARRESLRLLASNQREFSTEHEELPDDPAPVVPDSLLLDERRAALAAAFSKLPVRHAALMRMLIAEPAPSYAEIARVLDIPIGSIGPIRARSLARLRRDPELVEALAA
jgi:RNA polymerase sigma factor (sigma-70 family)